MNFLQQHKRKLGLLSSVLLLLGVVVFFGSSLLTSSRNLAKDVGQAATIQFINKDMDVGEIKYFYVNKATVVKPKVSAQAYMVGDLNTGEIILSKNPDDKMPIASVSKLMTALISRELPDPSGVSVVSRRALATNGKNGGFKLGEKLKTKDLLYPLLLESSNDAAEVLAEHFGRDTFLSKMNERAKSLQMTNTSYEDPSGLSPNNQSSVTDLFRLVSYIYIQKHDIIDITATKSYSASKHTWSNISKFLGDPGYIGGKTGYTGAARETVVSLFNLPLGEKGTRPIAITLLGSPDRHTDIENIVKYLKKYIYFGGEGDVATAWVTAKEKLPEIVEPDFITMSFVGDIMLDRGVRNSVIKNYKGDYSALFGKLTTLKDADIAFANLEGPMSDVGTDKHNLYSFRMDPAGAPALAGAGFNIVSVANNHVGDWGPLAYVDTLSTLKENEIAYTGGGNDAVEAETPTVFEKNGIRVGFLAFSDKGPNDMEVTNDTPGLLLASNPRFDEIIQNAAKQVDHLVVSFHFGDEYKTKHNERQAYLAHKAIDDGAKLVIGAHPHVIQDTEVYKQGYIAYSLGNFIFDQAFSTNTMQGMMLNVTLKKDGSMTIRKDISKQNRSFKPDTLIKGKEEKIKFAELPKPVVTPSATTPNPITTPIPATPTTTNSSAAMPPTGTPTKTN